MHSFASRAEVEFCVQYKCGCTIDRNAGQKDFIMDRLGFSSSTPKVVVVDDRSEWQKLADN